MAAKSMSKGAMWILMGLLIVGLAGFGATNHSGSVSSVGSVGDAEIDVSTYANALQNELRALAAERGAPVSFSEARANGIDRQVLAQLVSRAALEHEAARIGISVGDETLRDQIVDIPGFQGLDGRFDPDTYRASLRHAGLTATEFENSIRAQTASTLVHAAALAGLQTPATYIDTMMTYLAERRSVSFVALDRNNLTAGLPVPTEAELRAYHQSHLPQFTTPEAKKIAYAWVTPALIIDKVEVDETALRAAYAAREAEFNLPERRLVERLVFADAEAAARARGRIDQGIMFEMLVAERGLELSDVDMGDVSAADLGAAADPVFAAEPGEVVGPVDTSLGPALFRVNAVLAAQVTSFEAAEPELRNVLAADRARRVIEALADEADDLLAGGATLEDVARETDLELGSIDWHPGLAEGIAGYDAFRAAADEVTENSYPGIEQLGDGGIFALRLDGIEEPRIQPLEDVREAVLAGWRTEATVAALKAQIAPQLEELRSGADFDDLGFTATQVSDITRRDYQPDAPPEFIETVFDMASGEVRIIEGAGRIHILRLESVEPPAEDDEDLDRLRAALRNQVAADLGQDMFQLLAEDIQARAGVTLDQTTLNAVHANFH
ncbi:peptidyl-prolyl cis-trans isomerase D [Roseovarius azorensis]|uniref:Parvulin-like PPIase n=1 Tax=Roseovarius azorensis TaxID=1287727 RepID=A0A1H7TU46_9RHOB|nr:peptidylprolyl isomerase [Roseovarius azorensis]SEL88261.1 peptidyl-prolyl cis-trans isomerase D [Roseovarius azorensis]